MFHLFRCRLAESPHLPFDEKSHLILTIPIDRSLIIRYQVIDRVAEGFVMRSEKAGPIDQSAGFLP